MSLVSTASDSSSRSCAAQRGDQRGLARTDRPADADAQRLPRRRRPLGPFGVAMRFAVDEMWWHGQSTFQETNRGRSRSACRCASTSSSGSDRSASSLAAVGGGLLAQLATARRSARRRRRGRGPAAAARRSPSRSWWCRRSTARSARASSPLAAPTAPAATAEMRRGAQARPSRRRARPGAPAAAVRGPGRGTPAGPREPVCGHRFRRRRPSTPRRPRCTAAAIDAVTSPLVRIRRRRKASQRGEVDDQPAGDRFLDAAGVHVAAGRQPRVGQGQQGVSADSAIRTGSSVAPWAVRRRAAPATPRRRCAR